MVIQHQPQLESGPSLDPRRRVEREHGQETMNTFLDLLWLEGEEILRHAQEACDGGTVVGFIGRGDWRRGCRHGYTGGEY